MKRKIFILVILLFLLSNLVAWKKTTIFEGKKVIESHGYHKWEHIGADVNSLSLSESMRLLAHTNIISKELADSLSANFPKAEKTLLSAGSEFYAMIHGLHQHKIWIGQVILGKDFYPPASAWKISVKDVKNCRIATIYYVEDGLNNKNQCNNILLRFEPLIEKQIEYVPEIRYVPKPYPEPYAVHDTVKVEVEGKPYLKWCGWVSHSQDHFPEPKTSLYYGEDQLPIVDSDEGKLIYSLMGNITGKMYFSNWATLASFEWGYQDGPQDWKLHLGAERNWSKKRYLEFGFELRYYQFTHYWWEVEDLEFGSYLVKNKCKYFGITELGPYFQWDQFFGRRGNNHIKFYGSQAIKPLIPKIGTTEIQSSIKLEPKNFYIFAAGKYQITPSEKVDTLRAPKFQHISWESRLGYSVSRNLILFLRHRGINHNQYADSMNEWSIYKRRDYSIGLFYRPVKFLGIRNLYWELLSGYSQIREQFENDRSREDDLLEVKITAFYNWKF